MHATQSSGRTETESQRRGTTSTEQGKGKLSRFCDSESGFVPDSASTQTQTAVVVTLLPSDRTPVTEGRTEERGRGMVFGDGNERNNKREEEEQRTGQWTEGTERRKREQLPLSSRVHPQSRWTSLPSSQSSSLALSLSRRLRQSSRQLLLLQSFVYGFVVCRSSCAATLIVAIPVRQQRRRCPPSFSLAFPVALSVSYTRAGPFACIQAGESTRDDGK